MGPRQEITFPSTFVADEKNFLFLALESAGVAQLVEHNLAKVRVAGSSPVSRSNKKVPPKAGILFFEHTDDMLARRRDEKKIK